MRDYLAEMDEIMSVATEGSGWIASVLAAKIYAKLMEEDRELIDGWLHAAAIDTLRRQILSKTNAARTRERARAQRGEFADQARDFETGDDAGGVKLLGMFALMHTVNAEDVRKRAGEMTGADHLFVADSYQQRGQRNLMEAAFHRAVAAKVGDKRTDEVLDLETYSVMYRSITGTEGKG
jgi:hypothetical protein